MFRIIFQYIKGYKKNAITIIMGITLSVALMFSLIQMGDSILFKLKEYMAQMNPVDLQVSDINEQQMNTLEEAVKKKQFSHEVKYYVSSMNYGNVLMNNNIPNNLIGVKGNPEEFYDFDFIEGEMFRNDYEVVLDKYFVDNMDKPCKIGDEISLKIGDHEGNSAEKKFRVSGIVKNMSGISGVSSIFTSYNTYLEVEKETGLKFQDSSRIIQLISDKYGFNYDKILDLQDDIMYKLGYKTVKNGISADPEEAKKILSFMEEHCRINNSKAELYEDEGSFKTFGNTLKYLTVLISICMIIFVYNTIHISITQKIKQYGAMRCIGLSKKQLMKLIIFETAFYSFCGIVLGIVLGNVINSIIATKIISLLIWDNIKVNICQTVESYILVIIIAIVSVAIAMIKIFINIRKMTPIQSLNYTETSNYKQDKHKEIKINTENHFLSSFAKRNLNRNKGKSRTVVITLTVSVMLLSFILNVLFLSVGSEKLHCKSDIADYEINLNIMGNEGKGLTSNELKIIEENESVRSLYGQAQLLNFNCEKLQGDIKYNDENKDEESNSNLLISGVIVYDDNLFKRLCEEQDNLKNLDYKNETVTILSTPPSIKSDLTKVLLKNTEDKKEYPLSIDSIIENGSYVSGMMANDFISSYVIINENTLKNKLGIEKCMYTDLLMETKDIIDVSYIKNNLLKGFDITINDLKNTANSDRNQLLGIIALAIYVVIATLVLSFLIMNNTIKANIISRFKENGVLRAIGLEKKYLCKIACKEQLRLSLKAVVIGSFISAIISIKFSMKVNKSISFVAYIIVALFIVVSSLIITKITMKKSMKYKIIDMLREE